ncbi:bifunctional folylpolyglutamate synthase/dihydrofolate synthase [Oceanithermus sp.]
MRLEELERLQRRGVRPGLERIRFLLARLGNPQLAFPVVLVGGSNGKGSASRALAAIMQEAGARVGLYTSPHLVRFNERIAVSGRPAASDELEELLGQIWEAVEASGATFFEAVTALALLYFARRRVDLAVLEVGLGGRFDAVNACEPELSLITSLSLEHRDWLGPSLRHIAREKAGIMRAGRPVLSSASGLAARLLLGEARRKGAGLELVYPAAVEPSGYGVDFSLAGRRYHGSLIGRHQAENLALAVRAAERLGASSEAIGRGLASLSFPGRLSYYPKERLLCDGAHNPAAAAALARALDDYFPATPKTLVFAVSRDKDVSSMAGLLRPHFYRFVVTGYPGPRSRPASELARYFPGALAVADPVEALARARRDRPAGELTVVSGSLYLLGALARVRAGLSVEERFQ